jgi:hypothetical protein
MGGMTQGSTEAWPELPLAAWQDTYATLQLWTQIVGKLRLALAPHVNHWWQVTLYVSSSGLTTGPIPYGAGSFTVEFDFLRHVLRISTSDGRQESFPLQPMTVAEFYREFMARLRKLGIAARIWTRPQEIPDPVTRFENDTAHGSYDPDYANRFWRILVQCERLFARFRSGFIGKVSPVHFFWGSFDLAVTRFSGRPAPQHPGGVPNLADWVAREAYSHECSSGGFWPGGGPVSGAAFYSYTYPAPPGFPEAKVAPGAAYFHPQLGEFILPYDAVRAAADPDALVLDFLHSTYEAGANLGKWEREALERNTSI